jgi:hypothetical protein
MISRGSEAWLEMIKRVFARMTSIPEGEIDAGLRSPHLSLFLFQFSDYGDVQRRPRPIDRIL